MSEADLKGGGDGGATAAAISAAVDGAAIEGAVSEGAPVDGSPIPSETAEGASPAEPPADVADAHPATPDDHVPPSSEGGAA